MAEPWPDWCRPGPKGGSLLRRSPRGAETTVPHQSQAHRIAGHRRGRPARLLAPSSRLRGAGGPGRLTLPTQLDHGRCAPCGAGRRPGRRLPHRRLPARRGSHVPSPGERAPSGGAAVGGGSGRAVRTGAFCDGGRAETCLRDESRIVVLSVTTAVPVHRVRRPQHDRRRSDLGKCVRATVADVRRWSRTVTRRDHPSCHRTRPPAMSRLPGAGQPPSVRSIAPASYAGP